MRDLHNSMYFKVIGPILVDSFKNSIYYKIHEPSKIWGASIIALYHKKLIAVWGALMIESVWDLCQFESLSDCM